MPCGVETAPGSGSGACVEYGLVWTSKVGGFNVAAFWEFFAITLGVGSDKERGLVVMPSWVTCLGTIPSNVERRTKE